jgi:hypothetical protein
MWWDLFAILRFKWGFADNCSFIEELRQGRRERAAAYWLRVPWVCAYQTMHGDLSPADLLVSAQCLFMGAPCQFVPPEFQPLQRKSQGSD